MITGFKFTMLGLGNVVGVLSTAKQLTDFEKAFEVIHARPPTLYEKARYLNTGIMKPRDFI